MAVEKILILGLSVVTLIALAKFTQDVLDMVGSHVGNLLGA